jgi:gas vesicle protein
MAENDSTSSAVDRLTYLLIGAGIGATVALLFAPKSGRELRTDLADASHRGLDYTKDGARKIGERATEVYGQAAQKATDLYGTTAEKAQNLVEAGKETISAKREQLHHAIEAGKEAYVEEKHRAQAGGGATGARGAEGPSTTPGTPSGNA